ncbi:MAG: glycosyltransferase, partial [Pirellulaceae bacterium]
STAWPSFIAKQQDKRKNRRVRNHYDLHIAGRSPELETFSMAEHLRCANLDAAAIAADVIHLHWIAFMADYPTFFTQSPPSKPIVWTLHDMNPFTGGCHFTTDCQRFHKGCGNCPQIQNPGPNDVSQHSFQLKRHALSTRRNLTVVSPSRWLLNEARQSPLWPATTQFEQIKYGLDLEVFHPQEKTAVRLKSGLPIDGVVVGFGADNLNNPRKGFAMLERALALAPSSRTHLSALIMGGGGIDTGRLNVRTVHPLGFLTGEIEQANAYGACDFFVVPSLADNQPQMALEALACGVPVIAFDSGGISEVVADGINGLLAAASDVEGLAKSIERLTMDSELRLRLAVGAKDYAMREHAGKAQADKYLSLYARISTRHA